MNQNMKSRIINALFLMAIAGCAEVKEEYDIDLPVATVTSVSDQQPYVDDEITLEGENLNTASNISIGAYNFSVVSTATDGKSMIVKVPRIIEAGAFSVLNEYKRSYQSDVRITPQFYEAIVKEWPTEIQLGKPFIIKGENMDLLGEVKLAGTKVSPVGTPTSESATYASSEASIAVGDEVYVEVTPKNGSLQTSPAIKIVTPTDTYIPKSSLMVLDTNASYTVENGSDGSATQSEVTGLFGKAFRVTAPVGNGWNGTYCKIYSDNNGKGFDLSAYNDPHITILINTFGKQGYMQPITYDSTNGEQDRHLDGKFGYGDDYKSSTNGWEWRSYSMKTLDFPVVKGKIDKIGVQFRGGNVGNSNTEAFDIAVNMVMITDGPLNPTLIWNCETDLSDMGAFSLKNTGSGGLTGVNEGSKFASYTAPITSSWDWKTAFKVDVAGLDMTKYSNGIWLNFLVNTGNNNGYCQVEYGHTNGLDWFNFLPNQGYGDDYKFKSTENKWVWRSVRFNPADKGLDPALQFYLKFGATTGNWDSGTFELNIDYIVLTTTPMDTTLNTDDF